MLHLERLVHAPPDSAFAACVEPEKIAEWWGPYGFTASSVELDARVGGSYRLAMHPPEGDVFHIRGEFREIDRPRRLVYTFEYEEPDPDDRETVVELSFLDDVAGTRVVLDQGPFETEARRALHEAGWTDTLERLARFLSE